MADMRTVGTFSVRIRVGAPDGSRHEEVDALVDTGATYTTLPSDLLDRLGIRPHRTMTFELADGRLRDLGVGRARVAVGRLEEFTLVAFADGAVPALLGAVTLEEMGLAVDPVGRRLVPTTALLMTSAA